MSKNKLSRNFLIASACLGIGALLATLATSETARRARKEAAWKFARRLGADPDKSGAFWI